MHNVKNQLKKTNFLVSKATKPKPSGFSACWPIIYLAMNGNVLRIFPLKIEAVISTVLKTQVNKDRSTKLDFFTTMLGLEIVYLNAKRLAFFKPLKISL